MSYAVQQAWEYLQRTGCRPAVAAKKFGASVRRLQKLAQDAGKAKPVGRPRNGAQRPHGTFELRGRQAALMNYDEATE